MVMLFAASNICIEIDGMKAFIFKELAVDTEYNFNCSPNVVQGGGLCRYCVRLQYVPSLGNSVRSENWKKWLTLDDTR
ncbi:hypothetical protein MTR_7g074050 [Medicago truncatula]|uniref:Uncharacterized protein n=1 Tax=Medicago truncatula TaxID=3880 RepID=G7KY79_MEDTR|nr:hypothetical protein MTR_7g074050 [Medicago truncatula]